MARKYSRDNRGRFASSGTGATARGGRLKTASGNKRATQTSQMPAAPRAGTVGKGGKVRGAIKPVATAKPTQAPGSRIRAPKTGGVSRARLSGQKMNEGAGKRGAARQQRQQTMAIQRQMLGRVKPGKSAEPLATGGTLAARASLKRARAKAGQGASPAQRGAVTRAGTYLKASKERNRAVVKGAKPGGTVAKPKGLKQGAVTARVRAAKPATTKPTINRTRKQAAAAQLDRKRQTLENTKAIRGKQSLIAPEGISRRSVKVNQRNVLTGGVDRVTTKVQTKVQGERVSPLSSFGRKNTARSERASNRLDALIQARRNTPKPRKATERAALAKIQKSISTVTRSFDSYRNARSGRRTKQS